MNWKKYGSKGVNKELISCKNKKKNNKYVRCYFIPFGANSNVEFWGNSANLKGKKESNKKIDLNKLVRW